LGNGEVTLLALTNAYATLASQGRWQEPRLWQGQEPSPLVQALSPQASALITHALADDQARSLSFGAGGVLSLPFPAAVKTGTSQQHRDNWCLGYSRDYTVGVWAGNFAGQPMRGGVSGISGAAPLWRQVMLLLHQNVYGSLPPDPPGLSKVKVCLDSGLSPGPLCRRIGEELVMRPLAQCDLHPTEIEPGLAAASLTSPAPDGVYALDPNISPERQALTCRLRGLPAEQEVSWYLNGRELTEHRQSLRLVLTPGRHVLAAASGEQRVQVSYTVLGNIGENF
jgi:penicillin-binding protein 1C